MKKFITVTLVLIGLCFSSSTVLADQNQDPSQGTEDNKEKPTNILESVKQKVNHSQEVDQENRDNALENDLAPNPPPQQNNGG